jgi:hypothetical protein
MSKKPLKLNKSAAVVHKWSKVMAVSCSHAAAVDKDAWQAVLPYLSLPTYMKAQGRDEWRDFLPYFPELQSLPLAS